LKKGIVLTGGGAMIHGLDQMMGKILGVSVTKPDNPIDAVGKGLSIICTKIPIRNKGGKNITNNITEYYKENK
jgi:actin-like ATPase involved in cell morphogenesis